jgi:hypothetical protein
MSFATGMAVGINGLYLQNNLPKPVEIQIKNLDKNAGNLILLPNSLCKIPQKLIFLPEETENNSFVIMLQNMRDPIVMDKDGKLSLASLAKLKFTFSGKVKDYNFLGYCANKLQQSKLLSVILSSDLYSLPLFNLKNCNAETNFVYVINQNKQFKPQNTLDFTQIKPCSISKNES